MNDNKIISELIRKHLKTETVTKTGFADSVTDATDSSTTVLEMAKAVWEQGYPALRDVFAQRIQLPKGKTSHVVPIPELKEAGITWLENTDHVDMSYITVIANQKRSLNFGWNHEYLLMATWDAVAPQLAEMGRAIEESIFKYCLDVLADGADAGHDSMTDITTFDTLIAAMKLVAADNYNPDTLVLSIESYYELLKDDSFVNVSVMGSADPIRTGKVQTTLGVTVFATSVLASGQAIIFDSKKALCVVEVADKITEEYAYPDDNLYGVVGRTWFGAAVILPKAIACTATAEDILTPPS
jgi:hypothetical protein